AGANGFGSRPTSPWARAGSATLPFLRANMADARWRRAGAAGEPAVAAPTTMQGRGRPTRTHPAGAVGRRPRWARRRAPPSRGGRARVLARRRPAADRGGVGPGRRRRISRPIDAATPAEPARERRVRSTHVAGEPRSHAERQEARAPATAPQPAAPFELPSLD